MLHLNRDRQNLGQFSPEEVAEGLRTGRFLPTDLAWREGMEGWLPLSNFTDLPIPNEPVVPTLAPGSETGISTPIVPGPPMPEWERYEEAGFLRAWLTTVRQVITDPVKTFREMTKTGGFQRPFLYSYVTGVVSALIGVLGSMVWFTVLPKNVLPAAYQNISAHALLGQMAITIPALLVAGVITPFAFGGLYFLMVKMLTKKDVNFETIFRAYCYMTGTLALINLLPVPPIQAVQIIYVFFAGILAMVYLTIAMRESAQLTTMEALGVVVLPMILFCFCCAAMAGTMMALVGTSALQNIPH
jgi:hypothetical protein